MDLSQLRSFLAVADELHFGRAAQRLEVLPATLGRTIRQLEDRLGAPLFVRTTRSVALTADGAALRDGARSLLAAADELERSFRQRRRANPRPLRLGTIDTASAGLVPALLHDLRRKEPGFAVQVIEDKTVRLLPRLLSGRLDLAFVRPPEGIDKSIEVMPLFHERACVAVPAGHPLATRRRLTVRALADLPLIVPDRGSRPHSHDLTTKLFANAGLRPTIAQVADEKQTIVNLVAAGLGLAIVPRWAARLGRGDIRFVPLSTGPADRLGILPLAAAWPRGTRDPVRDEILSLLRLRLSHYAADA